jgi:hypothetical protein
MTFKHAAKTSAYALGMFVFGIKPKATVNQPKLDTEDFDIDAHIAAVQASFRYAVKDDLK